MGRAGSRSLLRLRLVGLVAGLGLTVALIVWFAALGPNWVAPIAKDGVEASDIQARAALAQVVIGGLTLLAAFAAALFAKGSIDVAREAHAARLHLDLLVMSALDDSIGLAIHATNYGGSGCVIQKVCTAFVQHGRKPTVLTGPPVSISLLPNERKDIGRAFNPSIVAAGENNFCVAVTFEGPFLAKGGRATARFEVSPQGLINGIQFIRLSDAD
jgi:hypothetical protein